jgi:undecaprenyl-diphosphatase
LLHAASSAGPPAIYHMNFLQAIVLGLIQGIFELFPLSSLGHTVLIPSWIGGSWATLVRQESLSESPYLAFIVGLHLANAVVLLLFFIREWVRLIVGFVRSLVRRRIETDAERLAWLVVIATIPVGILGLVLEHSFRTLFAKPVAAAIFLTINGLILFTGEWFRRRSEIEPERRTDEEYRRRTSLARLRDEAFVSLDAESEGRLARQITLWSAIWIGTSQSLALLAGISREGIAMVGGLYRGLSNENALRFAFLLSTPVIFAAGALKVPDLLGHLGNGIRGQVLAGSVAAIVASFLAILFLTRYFKTKTLVPFGVYCLLFGLASVIRFAAF